EDLSVLADALLAELISRSSTSCTVVLLKSIFTAEAAKGHDPYQIANGHDVAAILGIALRKLLSKRRVLHTWASEIEAGLRLAFDWEALLSTRFYKCLRAWEANNNPYRIFRQFPTPVSIGA